MSGIIKILDICSCF